MDVSRETYLKIESFVELLCKWNKRINLIAKESEGSIWERHINNALELLQYLPSDTKTLFDLGSGGGIPGLIIAIARPSLECILVESDARKCAFLREAASSLDLKNVTVQNQRIERLTDSRENYIFISRALAPLDIMFRLIPPSLLQGAALRLLKGRNATAEIEKAKKEWNFNVDSYATSDSLGYVLAINNVSLKGKG